MIWNILLVLGGSVFISSLKITGPLEYLPFPKTPLVHFMPMDVSSCLNSENTELALRYVQWKVKTAKRLSKNGNLLLGKGLECKVVENAQGVKQILFYKKEIALFSVAGGALNILKESKKPKQYQTWFCELLSRAKFAGLPLNFSYRYHDGSNNTWFIGPSKIAYKPVSPAMSSSGTYNGGEPFEKNITAKEFQEIEALLKAGIEHKAIQESNRLMGSGMVVELITDNLAGAVYYLPMRSSENLAIDDWLKQRKD